MLAETEHYYGLGMTDALEGRTFFWFGHGCFGVGMVLESWNTSVIVVWVGDHLVLEHEHHYGWGIDHGCSGDCLPVENLQQVENAKQLQISTNTGRLN